MAIFAISNHKGGVGKTTSTVNIGAGFALKGKKVLLIDLDPQANLTQSLGIKNPEISIYDNLRGEKNIIPIEVKKNLYVLPSSLDLSAAEIELNAEPGREYILRDIISKIKDRFDYILIDCPPSLGLLTINALTASNHVIIPLQAEFLPLKGLVKLNDVIEKIKNRLNPALNIIAVFLTQYDHRKVLNRDVSEMIKDFYGDKMLESKISSNIALAEAPSQGKDIFLYNKNCKGATDYKQLCEELLEKAGK
ncbi:MAG: chromosome partitioning protein ParA [Alphaproteobacteria bacterium CG_4_10_14_0_8_um_filter_37_21]|nr:MAG: chromosome partitioning protein ParA [Alphaproteobacteria bacterium CG_4_10_14_0_8_um_filter_37_21]